MGKLSRVEQSSSVVVVVTVVLKERARRGCLCDFSDWRLLLCFSSVLFDVSMGQLLRVCSCWTTLIGKSNLKKLVGKEEKREWGSFLAPLLHSSAIHYLPKADVSGEKASKKRKRKCTRKRVTTALWLGAVYWLLFGVSVFVLVCMFSS